MNGVALGSLNEVCVVVDSILNTGLQGINSGVNRVREAAQDIASATTTDTFAANPINPPAGQTGNGSTPAPAATDGDITADLATSIVDLKIGEIQVKASAKVIETADAMIGAVIDIKA